MRRKNTTNVLFCMLLRLGYKCLAQVHVQVSDSASSRQFYMFLVLYKVLKCLDPCRSVKMKSLSKQVICLLEGEEKKKITEGLSQLSELKSILFVYFLKNQIKVIWELYLHS